MAFELDIHHTFNYSLEASKRLIKSAVVGLLTFLVFLTALWVQWKFRRNKWMALVSNYFSKLCASTCWNCLEHWIYESSSLQVLFLSFFVFFSFWCHIPPAEQSKQNCSRISPSLNHGRECCRDTNQSPWKQWHHQIRGRTKLLNFINKLQLSPISCSTRNYIKSWIKITCHPVMEI